MKRITVANALSTNMFNRIDTRVMLIPVSIDKARALIKNSIAEGREVVSAIGHADTARIVSDMLGVNLNPNRTTVRIDVKDGAVDEVLLVAQYTGPRLAEGATTLPDGAKIEFWVVVAVKAYLGFDYSFDPELFGEDEGPEDPLVAIRTDGKSNFDSIFFAKEEDDEFDEEDEEDE